MDRISVVSFCGPGIADPSPIVSASRVVWPTRLSRPAATQIFKMVSQIFDKGSYCDVHHWRKGKGAGCIYASLVQSLEGHEVEGEQKSEAIGIHNTYIYYTSMIANKRSTCMEAAMSNRGAYLCLCSPDFTIVALISLNGIFFTALAKLL